MKSHSAAFSESLALHLPSFSPLSVSLLSLPLSTTRLISLSGSLSLWVSLSLYLSLSAWVSVSFSLSDSLPHLLCISVCLDISSSHSTLFIECLPCSIPLSPPADYDSSATLITLGRKGGPSPRLACPHPSLHLPEFHSMLEALGLSFIPSQTFTGSQPDPCFTDKEMEAHQEKSLAQRHVTHKESLDSNPGL